MKERTGARRSFLRRNSQAELTNVGSSKLEARSRFSISHFSFVIARINTSRGASWVRGFTAGGIDLRYREAVRPYAIEPLSNYSCDDKMRNEKWELENSVAGFARQAEPLPRLSVRLVGVVEGFVLFKQW
jgi:hypothetical protein